MAGPRNSLPFEYLIRGAPLEYLHGSEHAQAVEQRDAELEDHLGRVGKRVEDLATARWGPPSGIAAADSNGTPAHVAVNQPLDAAWGNAVADAVVQRFTNLAALKASTLPVGTLGVVMNDSRWGILVKTASGWLATRYDVYSGTTDSVGRITLSLASFGFASVNFVVPSGSISFGTDIANLLPFARVVGANFEFYFFKITNAGLGAYDSAKAVSFAVSINGFLTP